MSQLTHKYINRIPEREENLFLEEYYSGTDTKVFIDNDPQTEIAYISYSVSEQLKPLYGYASRTWDDVAVGNRIVTGTFKVSIKNPEEQSSREEVIEHKYVDKEQSTLEEIAEMNKAEEEAKQEMEWPNDTSGTTSGDEEHNILLTVPSAPPFLLRPPASVELTPKSSTSGEDNTSTTPETSTDSKVEFSQEVQDYQYKLILLGYNIAIANGLVDSNGDCIGTIKETIIQFCRDNNITETGGFKTHVKEKIDELIDNQNLKETELYSSTSLRAGPGLNYGEITKLAAGTIVYIVNSTKNLMLETWIQIKTKDLKFTGWIRQE